MTSPEPFWKVEKCSTCGTTSGGSAFSLGSCLMPQKLAPHWGLKKTPGLRKNSMWTQSLALSNSVVGSAWHRSTFWEFWCLVSTMKADMSIDIKKNAFIVDTKHQNSQKVDLCQADPNMSMTLYFRHEIAFKLVGTFFCIPFMSKLESWRKPTLSFLFFNLFTSVKLTYETQGVSHCSLISGLLIITHRHTGIDSQFT